MPAQTTTANVNIAALLGSQADKAWEVNRDLQPTQKNEGLPEGIEGGVAQLKKCWIGQYKDGPNKGKPFFMASGVILSPAVHNNIRIQGLHTQIGPEPLLATPTAAGKRKTYEDHYAWMMNELMLLGVTNKDALRPANLQATFNALIAKKVCFRFRTWKGSKQEPEQRGGKWYVGQKGPYASLEALKAANKYVGQEPRVIQEWCGACPTPTVESNGQPEEVGVIDETGAADSAGSHGTTFNEFEGQEGTDQVVGEEPAAAPTEPEESQAEEPDLAALVEAATADDEEAKAKLEELAGAVGITSQEVSDAPAWQDVADWIAAGGKPAEDDGASSEIVESEPEPEPEKPAIPAIAETGWQYQYKDARGRPVIDAKTKKVKKPVEVEILTVSTKNKTATVKDLVTGKPILGVDKKPLQIKWTELTPV